MFTRRTCAPSRATPRVLQAAQMAAIYTRVSSNQQREAHTIASQTAALVEWATTLELEVPQQWIFEDEGYSGATLERPGLEQVRDLAAAGDIQVVLVHSPDRLSRKYAYQVLLTEEWVRLFFVEDFSPYSWAPLPADASLQWPSRGGDIKQASAYRRLSGSQPSLVRRRTPSVFSPTGALPSGHSRGVLVRCRGKGGRPAMAVTTGFQGRTFDVPRTCVPCIDPPRRAPCAAADAVFADAKAFLSSSEARQMSESELERELHRRGQELVRKLLQGHRDQRSPKETAGSAEDTSGVECSEPREHESHAETASGTMQVVGLGCARRGHDGLHRLDAGLNLLPERYLVEMRRRVTIATASRAPPRTPWKPPWYSTSSTWQRRRGVRCSSPAHRRACRHLVRRSDGSRPAHGDTWLQLRRSSAAAGSRSLDALLRKNLASAVLARGLDKRRLRER